MVYILKSSANKYANELYIKRILTSRTVTEIRKHIIGQCGKIFDCYDIINPFTYYIFNIVSLSYF